MSRSLLNALSNSLFPTALWRGNLKRREIALTFDDGPVSNATSELLAVLDELAVCATFFMIGERAIDTPHLVRQVAEAGHQLGLHGYKHQSFVLKRRNTLLAELAKTQRVLAEASGVVPEALNAVRPPYGHFTPHILKNLSAAGYLPTMWTLVPLHWLQSLATTVDEVHANIGNGAILVLHEGLQGPSAADLAQALLPRLIAEGYRFVTIHELWSRLEQKTP